MRTIQPKTKKVADIEPYKNFTPEKVPVNQFGLDGKYIQTFESQAEAGKKLKILPSLISNCLAGRAKSAAGFQWRRA
jgi:hypothetical protein